MLSQPQNQPYQNHHPNYSPTSNYLHLKTMLSNILQEPLNRRYICNIVAHSKHLTRDAACQHATSAALGVPHIRARVSPLEKPCLSLEVNGLMLSTHHSSEMCSKRGGCRIRDVALFDSSVIRPLVARRWATRTVGSLVLLLDDVAGRLISASGIAPRSRMEKGSLSKSDTIWSTVSMDVPIDSVRLTGVWSGLLVGKERSGMAVHGAAAGE